MAHESTARQNISLKNSPNWPPPPPPRRNSIDSPNWPPPPPPRRSSIESSNWPPPPPPRQNPTDHTRTRQDNDLSKVLKSDLVEILPFPIDSARTLSRPFQQHLPGVNDSGNTSGCVPPSPPPPPPYRRRWDGGVLNNTHYRENKQVCVRRRRDYVLGDPARSPFHMMMDTCPQATNFVCELEIQDSAFVKRSDGAWSYAILAYRHRSRYGQEEFMVFLLNEIGATKIFMKRQWAKGIRCVASYEADLSDEMIDLHDVPKTIFVNTDDCSLISDF